MLHFDSTNNIMLCIIDVGVMISCYHHLGEDGVGHSPFAESLLDNSHVGYVLAMASCPVLEVVTESFSICHLVVHYC